MPPRSRASPNDAGATSSSPSSSAQTRVLMVCLGNICRSPAAEAVLAHLVKKRKIGDSVFVDSCGTVSFLLVVFFFFLELFFRVLFIRGAVCLRQKTRNEKGKKLTLMITFPGKKIKNKKQKGGGSGDWYKEGGFSYHEGDAADSRMRSAASKRGIAVTSRSRPLSPRDLEEFDVVVAMDSANRAAIARAREHWISKGKLRESGGGGGNGGEGGGGERARVVMMTDYLRDEKLAKLAVGAVPDPYYGGEKGFETVLDLLEDACEGLLEEIV